MREPSRPATRMWMMRGQGSHKKPIDQVAHDRQRAAGFHSGEGLRRERSSNALWRIAQRVTDQTCRLRSRAGADVSAGYIERFYNQLASGLDALQQVGPGQLERVWTGPGECAKCKGSPVKFGSMSGERRN